MGEVYEAHDCVLNERIALKTVASTVCDSPQAVRRLKAEVHLARRVSHPNVCRIYDLGSHVLGTTDVVVSFLTMEFVEGETLGEHLRQRGALSIDRALSFARQLLHGLSAAHRAGFLHRDFKSDNVMLRAGPDGELVPLILDFGLARSLDADLLRLSTGGDQGFVGTLCYMAPEQIEGKPLCVASDVYAFGVVWFEMLTGTLPFSGDSAAANGLARLHKPPPAPSRLNPQVPKALDRIVLRCLSRFPEDRFKSADEVIEALEALDASPRRSRYQTPQVVRAALAVGIAVGVAYWALAPKPKRANSTEARPPELTRVGAAKSRTEPAPPLPPAAPSPKPKVTPVAAKPGKGPASRPPPKPAARSQRLPAGPYRPKRQGAEPPPTVPPAMAALTTKQVRHDEAEANAALKTDSIAAPSNTGRLPAPSFASTVTRSESSPNVEKTPQSRGSQSRAPDWENPFAPQPPTNRASTRGRTDERR